MSQLPSSENFEVRSTDEQTRQDTVTSILTQFALSRAEFDELIGSMVVAIKRVGCPSHMHPHEVVHDAFVLALCKSNSRKRIFSDRKKFIAWMCKLAKFAALGNKKSKHRRLLGQGHTDTEFDALRSVSSPAEAIAMREALFKAFRVLDEEDRALIEAHHFDGKTIKEIAIEQNISWSTVNSRVLRIIASLRKALKTMVIAVVVLLTKHARAQGKRLVFRAARAFPNAAQTTCAIAVTVTCGVFVPTSSSGALPNEPFRDEQQTATAQPPSAVVAVPTVVLDEPRQTHEVAPEKRVVVDEAWKQCSASTMKATKISSYLQGTVVPLAFLVAPAMTQLACAGAERHTATQESEEGDNTGGIDPYDAMCLQEKRRGNDCPSKAEWYKEMGRCPDGTKGCQ